MEPTGQTPINLDPSSGQGLPLVANEPIKPQLPPRPSLLKRLFNKKIWIPLVAVVIIAVALLYFFVLKKEEIQPKTYHVGVLSAVDYFFPIVDALKTNMADLGYIEGENIFYDVQKGPAVGNQAILNKFVQDKVDLIVVFPTEATLEAKEATKNTNIPIISLVAYFEGNGLINTTQNPGGNITGVRLSINEVCAKRLETLNKIDPSAKRIMVPYLKDYTTVQPGLDTVKTIAASLGLTIVEAPFASPPEMTSYFSALASGDVGFDAILLIAEPVSIVTDFADQIFAFADAHKIPVAGVDVKDVASGPILGIMASNSEYARLAAPIADKIFRGTLVGSIPIATPENDLEINYKVIRSLGLTVPEDVLDLATKVVR
jgi:putative tryptophan/tyrosine transport system substrate-binding protein